MEPLSGWFEKNILTEDTPPVLTVIGSGGKTSLIWLLAQVQGRQKYGCRRQRYGCRRRTVLVTPSTRMLIPPPEARLYDRYIPYPAAEPALRPQWAAAIFPLPGVTLTGVFIGGGGSKLESLPPGELEAAAGVRMPAAGAYDLVLIEGDGSRGLPLKAWAAHEPVVPPFTTATVGVMPLRPLGQAASDRFIHRFPLFTALSGASEGEPLGPGHLVRVITGNRGLFTAARGKKILFFNQIDDGDLRQAEEVTALLPAAFLAGLYCVLAGSVRKDRVAIMFRGYA